MKSVLVSVLLLVVLFLSLSCNEGYDYSQAALGLGLRDYSCTEAWIEVQIGSNDKTANIYIKKNGEIIQTINVGQSSTLFYFDSLLPNTNYTFDAVTYEDGKEVKSNPVTFTTLDTTSHNFSWQTFEFGQHSSSTLYDVAIINENDIWAVGEIYMNDSLGNPDPTCYNGLHWDGQSWELLRIPYYYNEQNFYTGIRAMYAFNQNDVWFGIASLIHWNGSAFQSVNTSAFFPALINKMWGISSNDFYIAGHNGNIAYYNGSSWTKIESGTTTNINDAWGIFDNGTSTVFCPVSSVFNPPQDKKILKITNDKVDSISWGKNRIVYSCWTKNKNYLYVGGEGVYVNKFGTWEQITLPAITTNSIRGNDINDVFAVGSLGTIFHFNGINWQVISSYTQKENYRVAIQNNVVAICGYYNGKGFVEIGRRN